MKRIIVTALALAMLVSCKGNTAEPAVTTTGTVETSAPTETTVMTTVEETTDTEETTTEPSFTEFEINSEECLLYRLLDMTVGEIESEFGELELFGIIGGGTPCYRISEIGVLCYFNKYSDNFDEPLPKDIYPRSVETDGYSGEIYPGIYVGMDSKEFNDICGIESLNYSMADYFPGFSSEHNIGEYCVVILWNIPNELSLKAEEAICWGEAGEGESAKSELVTAMKNGDAGVTVGRITISKN